MNSYSKLMEQAASEVDAFLATGKPIAEPMSRESWVAFRDGFLETAACQTDEDAEYALDTDLYRACDSYELGYDICPSFWSAVDAMQRRQKRLREKP